VTFPECPSQIACSIAHSACDHWLLTVSSKFSFSIPASLSVEAEERSNEKLSVTIAQVKEIGVIPDVALGVAWGAEGLPPSPDSVVLFAGILLS
jgi:hypothetical protein